MTPLPLPPDELDALFAERLAAVDELLDTDTDQSTNTPSPDRDEKRWRQAVDVLARLHRLARRPGSAANGLSSELSWGPASDEEPRATLGALRRSFGLTLPESIGRYQIRRELGRGGMGIVYEGWDAELARRVAVKVIQSEGADHLARFKNEAAALAQVQHPGVVQIYEVGLHGSQPFLAMEYVEGTPLLPTVEGRLRAAEESARLLAQVADAVQAAHDQGILHRDLKPGNILVSAERGTRSAELSANAGPELRTPRSELHTAKVTDFGLAKRLDSGSNLTQSGVILGTPNYMAPEQAEGDTSRVGPASDVYSLGATLYELLTGRPPFQAAMLLDVLVQVRTQEPLTPQRLNSAVPLDLQTICLKCLEKQPARRYPTAAALAADLRRFLAHEPIEARPAGMLERAVKWSRRHPGLAGSLSALAAAIAAILALSLWFNVAVAAERDEKGKALLAEQKERREAEIQRDRAIKAQQEAREANADTRVFADFLIDEFLSAARPKGMSGLGADVTVAAALDRAVTRMAKRFAGRPAAEAVARRAIGATLRQLNRLPEALAMLEPAQKLLEAQAGPPHQELFQVRNSIATVYSAMGKVHEARTRYEALLPDLREHLGTANELYLFVRSSLGSMYAETGQRDRAVAELTGTLKEAEAAFGPTDRATVHALKLLVSVQLRFRNLKEAEALLKDLRERMKNAPEFEPIMELQIAFSQAKLHQIKRELAVALKQFQELTPRFEEQLGPNDLETLRCRVALAEAYSFMNHHDEAAALDQETVRRVLAVHGPDCPEGLQLRQDVLSHYDEHDPKQVAAAAAGLLALLPDAKRVLGSDHGTTLLIYNNLAVIYERQGKIAECVPLQREAVAGAVKFYGPDHRHTITMTYNLGVGLLKQGQLDEARDCLERSFAALVPHFGPHHAESLRFREQLMICLHRQKDEAAFQARLREQVETCRAQKDPRFGARFLGMVAATLLELDRAAEAEKLVREALPVLQEKAPDSWNQADLNALLGECLRRRQQWPEAKEQLEIAYKLLEKPGEPRFEADRRRRLTTVCTSLAKLFETTGPAAEAKRWRDELNSLNTEEQR